MLGSDLMAVALMEKSVDPSTKTKGKSLAAFIEYGMYDMGALLFTL